MSKSCNQTRRRPPHYFGCACLYTFGGTIFKYGNKERILLTFCTLLYLHKYIFSYYIKSLAEEKTIATRVYEHPLRINIFASIPTYVHTYLYIYFLVFAYDIYF